MRLVGSATKLWVDETGCGMEVISLSTCVHRHAIYWYCCHKTIVRCQLALLEWPGGTHNMPAFICREFNFQIIKRNVETLQVFVVIWFLCGKIFQCEWWEREGQIPELSMFTGIYSWTSLHSQLCNTDTLKLRPPLDSPKLYLYQIGYEIIPVNNDHPASQVT